MTQSTESAKRGPALLALITTAALWASAFPATKAALAGYGPGEVVFLRLTSAGICFALLLLPRGLARPRSWRDLPAMVALGLLGMAAYQSLLVFGQQSITASAAGLVITAVPIFTALLAAVTAGERLRRPAWLGLALGAIGVTGITASEGLNLGSIGGVVFILAAAGVTACYFVLQKPILRREPPVRFLAWAIWVSIPPVAWAAPSALAHLSDAPAEATFAAIYNGVFPMALGYGCYTFALARVPASLASSFIYLQPPLSVLIAWLWLGESPSALIFIGGALALAGVVLVTRFGVR